MKIGITSDRYPNIRTINYCTNNEYCRVNKYNINAYFNSIRKLFNLNGSPYYHGVMLGNICDVIHFFNTLSNSSHPWITTYETALPLCKQLTLYLNGNLDSNCVADKQNIEYGLSKIASPACKAIIALSACCDNIQRLLIHDFPQYEEAILPKMHILHPPQQLYITDASYKKQNDIVTFMFVGRDLYRKGGLIVLRACEKLAQSYEFKLILVSDLSNDVPAVFTSDMEKEARRIINKTPAWLEYYPSLPNQQVIQKMLQADVGLLPTYSDTYGYSVLEFQACGCPVISTNVRALPEINNEECGWIIPLQLLDKYKEIADIAYCIESQLIEKALFQTMEAIVLSPLSIRAKQQKSIERILSQHSFEEYAQNLNAIYQRALRKE